jgi:hypothetical protein
VAAVPVEVQTYPLQDAAEAVVLAVFLLVQV